MQFFLSMDPPTKTHQEQRIGKRKNGSVYVYEDRELKEVRHMLYTAVLKRAPTDPMAGPLELLVKWCWRKTPPVLSEEGARDWHEWKLTPPDTDNLDKLLKDCMTRAGFWRDDAQVCREIIEKHWAAVPGIYVRVTELEG